jgi:hypothetical protein
MNTNESTTSIPGWWLTYPSEKYESQWEGLSHILWKIQAMFQTTNQILMLGHNKLAFGICQCHLKSWTKIPW